MEILGHQGAAGVATGVVFLEADLADFEDLESP